MRGKKVLVTGATGQVGFATLRHLATTGASVIAGVRIPAPPLGVPQTVFDLARPESLASTLNTLNPECIIHPGAYTLVDKAEEESDLAFRVNRDAVHEIAQWAQRNDVPLVHFSTDYVYGVPEPRPINEEDLVDPKSVYGKSKLAGEVALQETGVTHIIFRTSWVYGLTGNNFIKTMLRLGKDREVLRVVHDQVGAPTSADTLATAAMEVVQNFFHKGPEWLHEKQGIYNLCHEGTCSWHAFAQEIFSLARQLGVDLQVQKVEGIPSEEYPTPALRPHNSRLDLTKIKETLGIFPPQWEHDLAQFLWLLCRQ